MDAQLDRLDEAFESYCIVMRMLHSVAKPHWLALDLTMAQLKTLLTLANAGPRTIGQVADVLGIGLPTASHLVDRLVQAGLAERTEDPADRRRTLARATAAGEELTRSLQQGGAEQLRNWLGRLDPADLDALLRGLRALVEVAGARSASAGRGS